LNGCEHRAFHVLTGLILMSSWKSNCWETVRLVGMMLNVLDLR
jgi:hypothetical protein